ncbi:hypothetical protein TNIN_489311, partial [Trichonephila inaurata madagascariensis]
KRKKLFRSRNRTCRHNSQSDNHHLCISGHSLDQEKALSVSYAEMLDPKIAISPWLLQVPIDSV